MYYELYIDVLFLVNFLMDYLLLLIAKRVLRKPASCGRICLGALAGALLTCITVAVRIPSALVKGILFYGLIPPVMLAAGIGVKDLRSLLRGVAALYIGGFLLGGIFTSLRQYVQVGSLFFALAVSSYYLASGVLRLLALLLHFGESHCQVSLQFGGRRVLALAVIDTGNHLRDPLSGKAVSVVSRDMAEKLFDGKLPEGMRHIPYRTIGKHAGTIPVIMIDGLRIEGEGESWIREPMIAVGDDSSFGNACDVIINPDI